MSAVSRRQRVRFLRQAVADLYRAAGGADPRGDDVDQFVRDPGAAREARIAITLVFEGRLNNGNGDGGQ